MIKLPYSQEAEEALLGALIINPEAIRTIGISPEQIYIERHRWLFEAMDTLSMRHDKIEYITICEELKRTGKLNEIGGEAYILKLITGNYQAYHAEAYAEIIKEKYRRRQIILAAQELATKAYDDTSNIEEAVAKVAGDIVVSAGHGEGARHISKVLSELFDEIDAASKNPREIFGIQTGFTDFDRITGGLQKSEVFMISGEPGIGKSFYAMQLGVGAAEIHNGIPGTPGALYELEMKDTSVVRRSLSTRSGIQARAMRTGKLTDAEWPLLTDAIEKMAELDIYISDRTDWTTTEIRADIARLKTHGIEWVIIDYLALLKDCQDLDEVSRSGIVSDRIHAIAKDLNVAVIAIHDMTKGAQNGDIKGQAGLSGHRRVGYNADMTAFLRSTKDPNIFSLQWEKFREDSPSRFINLRRVPGFPAYAEMRNLP